MSTAKSLAAAKRTKQYQQLLDMGLQLVSTERQLSNGTLAFTGKFKVGRQIVQPQVAVTATGAVISNEFVARRVQAETAVGTYRQGLSAVAEIVSKRLAV